MKNFSSDMDINVDTKLPQTENYYESNAQNYYESTLKIDMTDVYDLFLKNIPKSGRILDAGSGSGRDTLAFLKRGYEVDAFDASESLAKLSSQLTGLETKVIKFQNFESLPIYDGIWACASLLHVPKKEMNSCIQRLLKALKPNGAIYVCFKLGNLERVANDGRFYTDLNEKQLREILSKFSNIKILDIWTYSQKNTAGAVSNWVNAIAIKNRE
ncbi:MAG: class I SAM-dependent methyltransferase [Micavibrio sp.]